MQLYLQGSKKDFISENFRETSLSPFWVSTRFPKRQNIHPLTAKSKANNTAGLLAVRFFAAFSQPTHIVVSSLQLIHGPLVSLTDFLGSCAQAGCKLTARFSSLSSTSAFSQLTACYYTCSKLFIKPNLISGDTINLDMS